MGHGYGFVGAAGAGVVYDHSRGVQVGDVSDFLLVRTVFRSQQSHPGGVVGHRGETDKGVAALSVLGERRYQNQTFGFLLGRVLAVAPALSFLRLDLRCDRVQVGDVDKGGVPFLFLRHREVQTQQVDKTE